MFNMAGQDCGVGGVGVVPGEAGAGAGGAGPVAVPAAGAGGVTPLAGLAAAPGKDGMVRLCFWASGKTNGPFWPQPPATAIETASSMGCANFMCSSIARAALADWPELPAAGAVELA